MQASGLVSTFAGFCSTHACMPAIIDGFAPGRRGAVLLRPDHEVSRRLPMAAQSPSTESGGGWIWGDGSHEVRAVATPRGEVTPGIVYGYARSSQQPA